MRFFDDAQPPDEPIEARLADDAWIALPWLRGEERVLTLRQAGEVEYVGPNERLWQIPVALRDLAQAMLVSFQQPTSLRILQVEGTPVIVDLECLQGTSYAHAPLSTRLAMLRVTVEGLGMRGQVRVLDDAATQRSKRALHQQLLQGDCRSSTHGLVFQHATCREHALWPTDWPALAAATIARHRLRRTAYVRVDQRHPTTPSTVDIEVLAAGGGRWQPAGTIALPDSVHVASCEVIEITCAGSHPEIRDATFVRRAPEMPSSSCVV